MTELIWDGKYDKDLSLVDCASFVVMQQRRITQALTTDHHFEQAGFVRLLKPPQSGAQKLDAAGQMCYADNAHDHNPG